MSKRNGDPCSLSLLSMESLLQCPRTDTPSRDASLPKITAWSHRVFKFALSSRGPGYLATGLLSGLPEAAHMALMDVG